MKLTGKKLILLLLYTSFDESYNYPISGRTRFMKTVFLFEKEILKSFKSDNNIDEVDLPEFFAWKYGPFSSALLNDLEFLINQEYLLAEESRCSPIPEELEEYNYWVEDNNTSQINEFNEESFTLTEDKGIPKAIEFWNQLTSNQRELLTKFKSSLINAPLSRILEYVYKKYNKDGFIENSIIRERYL